jgi:linearmycin/streptolysin S transport system permease protein
MSILPEEPGVIRILDIAFNDIRQLMRERMTFMFLLVMPIAFTLMFGFAFGAFGGGPSDDRLPVGYLDLDNSSLSKRLHGLLAASQVVRLDEDTRRTPADLDRLVVDKKLPAAVIVPAGYGKAVLSGKTAKLTLIADTSSTAGTTIEAEMISAANRLNGAVTTASITEQVTQGRAPFAHALDSAIAAWDEPPIAVDEATSGAIQKQSNSGGDMGFAHTAPAFMLQFAIAGLLTAAQMVVTERKSRALQRLLTTATRRVHILLGHYTAMLALILTQFGLLILFGALVLKVNYAHDVGATLLVAVCAALCIASLGLLIGILARSEEQASIFALLPMFVFSGLGGAWVPLEVTGPTFQTIGHVSPVAWAMDGFQNIAARGLGLNTVLLPAAALVGYAALFFTLAAWRFWTAEER